LGLRNAVKTRSSIRFHGASTLRIAAIDRRIDATQQQLDGDAEDRREWNSRWRATVEENDRKAHKAEAVLYESIALLVDAIGESRSALQ